MANKKPNPAHRPTQYRADYANIAYRHTLMGATDDDLAAAFEVSKQTINTWKQKHPKFLDSLKKGKSEADSKVAESLYKRAVGYDHEAVKIFCQDGETFEHRYTEHYPPDTTAQIFWLKNRRPAQFRNNPEVAVTVNNDTEIKVDTSRPPEEWGRAEQEAYLRSQGIEPITSTSPKTHTATG